MYLVVGLGNPGREYERTRHNVGFLALDDLASRCGAEVKRLKHMALTGKGTLGGEDVLFMKPQTYMNRSGESVADAARFYRVPPERVVVLYDDVSLPVGAMRIRLRGSAGGHNGLKSVQEWLGSDAYVRFKFGVGDKAHPDMDLADHVLGKLSPADEKRIRENFSLLEPALRLLFDGKGEQAMALYNRMPKPQEEET